MVDIVVFSFEIVEVGVDFSIAQGRRLRRQPADELLVQIQHDRCGNAAAAPLEDTYRRAALLAADIASSISAFIGYIGNHLWVK